MRFTEVNEWDTTTTDDGFEFVVFNRDPAEFEDDNGPVRFEITNDYFEVMQHLENMPCEAQDVYFYDENGDTAHRDSTTHPYSSIDDECVSDIYEVALAYDFNVESDSTEDVTFEDVDYVVEFDGDDSWGGGHKVTKERAPGAEDWEYTGERVLVVYGEEYIPPGWPEALEMDKDVLINSVESAPDSVCVDEGTVDVTIELEALTLSGEFSGDILVENLLTGEVVRDESVSFDETTEITESISIPEDVEYGEQDIVRIEVE